MTTGPAIPNFHAPSFVVHSRFLPSGRAAKHAVVLLHAFPFSSTMWERMVSHLQSLRDDTALILIDFPGFGNSTPRLKWDFSSFSFELRGVIEQHTRKPVVVAGLSMGGYEALNFYRLNSSLVRGIVFSNTRASADSVKEKEDRAVFADELLARGPQAAIDRNYPNFVTKYTDPVIARDIRNWILEANPAAMASAQTAMANRNDSQDMLPLITIPSLVIASGNDRITRATEHRKMSKSLPNSTFVEIQDAAHLSAVEKPAEWAAALAHFLDRV